MDDVKIGLVTVLGLAVLVGGLVGGIGFGFWLNSGARLCGESCGKAGISKYVDAGANPSTCECHPPVSP